MPWTTDRRDKVGTGERFTNPKYSKRVPVFKLSVVCYFSRVLKAREHQWEGRRTGKDVPVVVPLLDERGPGPTSGSLLDGRSHGGTGVCRGLSRGV